MPQRQARLEAPGSSSESISPFVVLPGCQPLLCCCWLLSAVCTNGSNCCIVSAAWHARLHPEAVSPPPHLIPCSYLDGSKRTALFRLPNGKRAIKGTCIFVHGCKHDPESWFYKSPKCPKCTGELGKGIYAQRRSWLG